MFRNTYQKGFLSVFSSTGSKPLANWSMHVKNGHIKRKTDTDLNSLVLELIGVNVATTFICTPCPGFCSLAIKLPFLTLIVKNLRKYFTFEIQILDDRNQLRRFRVSNYQSTTRVKPFLTSMPLCLSPGWNQIQFNLADFVRRAYGTNYIETVRIQMHANVLLRRIFFSDRLYPEEEKPAEYRLFKSIQDIKKPTKRVPKLPKLSKQEEPIARPVSPITDTEAEEELKSMKLDEKEAIVTEIEPEKKLVEEETKTEEICEEHQEVEEQMETPGPPPNEEKEEIEEKSEPKPEIDEINKAPSKVSFRPEIEETIPENVVEPEEEEEEQLI
ncbi:uncharacterized protein LOC134828809 [Culicoides brevitarsis]|uniref:uncharacterized protein LOC134828809 n=1 Tax=Culicoides brevitarsis TaxID=469753 RepID=UPI00307C8C2B